MTDEELKTLSDKVASNNATVSEKAVYLKELNSLILGMKDDLVQARQRKGNV